MRVTLFDYGAGNLYSLARALRRAGADVTLETDPARLLTGDALVLPGVGAFGPAAARLAPARAELAAALAAGFPCLGICLGMQLLFEGSAEGAGRGLGLFGGRVGALQARRVPHMGWNEVRAVDDPGDLPGDPLLEALGAPVVYFAHGYVARPVDAAGVRGWTTHESEEIPALVRRARTWGAQFHPEKSGAVGQRILRNFLAAVAS